MNSPRPTLTAMDAVIDKIDQIIRYKTEIRDHGLRSHRDESSIAGQSERSSHLMMDKGG